MAFALVLCAILGAILRDIWGLAALMLSAAKVGPAKRGAAISLALVPCAVAAVAIVVGPRDRVRPTW